MHTYKRQIQYLQTTTHIHSVGIISPLSQCVGLHGERETTDIANPATQRLDSSVLGNDEEAEGK